MPVAKSIQDLETTYNEALHYKLKRRDLYAWNNYHKECGYSAVTIFARNKKAFRAIEKYRAMYQRTLSREMGRDINVEGKLLCL